MVRREIGTITFAMLEKRKSFRHYIRRDKTDARPEKTIILFNSVKSLLQSEASEEVFSNC